MSRLKALGGWSEFWIVMTGAFGWLLFTAATHLPAIGPAALASPYAEAFAFALVLSGCFAFLGLRGWTMPDLGFKPSWAGLVEGGVIALAAVLLSGALQFALKRSLPGLTLPSSTTEAGAALPMAAVLLLTAVRPMLEELLGTGYLMSKLAPRFGMLTAINASVALRLACHLHLGASAVIAVLPLGLAFAYWYANTRRLFPLVVAHAILEFVALTPGQ